VIAQVFLPKVYIADGLKLLLQYDGVVTGADFGVQAYGSFGRLARTPVLTLASEFGYAPINTMLPIGGGGDGGPPPKPPSKLLVFATTDDMRNPTFSFAGGGLRFVKATDPQQSAEGTQFTSIATFHGQDRRRQQRSSSPRWMLTDSRFRSRSPSSGSLKFLSKCVHARAAWGGQEYFSVLPSSQGTML
jgi:hypothetical protein